MTTERVATKPVTMERETTKEPQIDHEKAAHVGRSFDVIIVIISFSVIPLFFYFLHSSLSWDMLSVSLLFFIHLSVFHSLSKRTRTLVRCFNLRRREKGICGKVFQ